MMYWARNTRWLAVVLGVAFILSLGAAPAAAALPAADAQMTLEEAIVIAKTHFTVADDFDVFDSWYDDYNYAPQWRLSWSRSGGVGYLEIGVNAVNGDIVSMYRWLGDDQAAPTGPRLTLEQAQSLAAAKLVELLPDKAGSLRLMEAKTTVQLSGVARVSFSWARYAGEIPVSGDYAGMTIGLSDGSVRDYVLNWTEGELPDAAAVISPEAAAEAFAQADMLRLQYLLPNLYNIKDGGEPRPAQPVYYLHHASGGLIDALSGEPYIPKNDVYNQKRYMDVAAEEAAVAGGGGGGEVTLTPQEIAEISANEQLITREQAAAAVDKWFELDSLLTVTNASLSASRDDSGQRYWRVNWEGQADGRYAYAYATVDAATAEIINFNSWTDDPNADMTKKMSLSAAQQKAEKLAAAISPAKYRTMKMDEVSPEYSDPARDSDYYDYYFRYTRQMNGLPCPGNGIGITVDRITGAVTNYNLNWSEIEFATADNAITAAEAAQRYLEQSPLALCYQPEYDYMYDKRDVRFVLAYAPDFRLSDATVFYLDANTGVAVDPAGKELTATGMLAFDDIAGHFAAAEITLMGQAGLMGEYGASFKPDENITVLPFLRALFGLNYGAWYNETDAEEIMRMARDRKLIDATVNANDTLTREQAGVIVIRAAGLQKAAELPGIYLAPWQDNSVSAANVGYAALCWGLDIMRGDGVNFNGQSPVTRAETACILLRLMTQTGMAY